MKNLNNVTVKELRNICRSNKYKGYSKMKKQDLINLIETNQKTANIQKDTMQLETEVKNEREDTKPNFDNFITGIESTNNVKELTETIEYQITSLKKYYSIGSFSVKLSEYRKAIKNHFSDSEKIPKIFQNNHKGNVEHLAIGLTYQFAPREKIAKLVQENKKKSDKKLDDKIKITKQDIEGILTIAKKGIYQRDDVYYAIASLELLTGRRFVENIKTLSDLDICSNFKILVKRSELAKKHDNKEDYLEMITLEYAEGITDCIEWIRSNFNVSDLSKKEVTDRFLGTTNTRVKECFKLCKKHDSDYPTTHTLRAYSANIAWYFYGSESKDKRKFLEKYLGHDNDLSAKDYDRYYVDSNTFSVNEKQGYKAHLIDDECQISLPLSPCQLFKLELYGIDNLINNYEKKLSTEDKKDTQNQEIEKTKTPTAKTAKTAKTKKIEKKLTHFDILRDCVDKIVRHNEDKEKSEKIAITSRALYDVSGKRTPIISDFIRNSDYSKLIAKYNSDNGFGQKQNMGKNIRKRLGL